MDEHVIGMDFGTDSVRSVVVNAMTGEEVAQAVFDYPRWAEGLYCEPRENRFRHNPLDYVEGLEFTIREALGRCPRGVAQAVKGISAATTGSTTGAVDRAGVSLGMRPGFEHNPDAMFVIWKDHTGVAEAEEINHAARTWGGEDFTKYEGGVYSAEWFWSKILHVLRADEGVRGAACSWVELCDWIPALLTGNADALTIKRSRCAAGHKAMWHPSFGGLPPEEFLAGIDPLLAGVRANLYTDTLTSDKSSGLLCLEWAQRLGLRPDTVVGVGAFDAHMGAVGGGIVPNALTKVIGTSTCDIMVSPMEEMEGKLVRGICGQVEGSVIPGMLGMEAGQSAFGDVYAWFKQILMWPLTDSRPAEDPGRGVPFDGISDRLMDRLMAEAGERPVGSSRVVALDWLNGRRTPDADQKLSGAIIGLSLGVDAPDIFKSLVEATAFGAKAIVERFILEGVPVGEVIALGGVPRRAPYIMQTLADVFGMPVKVAASEQTCALGAAMFAATAGGIYGDVKKAQQAMGCGFDMEFRPGPENSRRYAEPYELYLRLGGFMESMRGALIEMGSFEKLKKIVYECNLELYEKGLAFHTFGNASGIDRDEGVVAIKPSGVPYKELAPEDIVLVNLDNEPVGSGMRPSSDTPTHTSLYRAFPNIGGVAHTHSTLATAWAQAMRPIPCLGTTHADYLPVSVPCTEPMTDEQVRGDYEAGTGRQIIKAFDCLSPADVPMVLVASHGPFTWGASPQEAVHHSAVLEELARMALFTMLLNPHASELPRSLIDRHFNRKHGEYASYGQ